jgi:signal transduction histidine kinase
MNTATIGTEKQLDQATVAMVSTGDIPAKDKKGLIIGKNREILQRKKEPKSVGEFIGNLSLKLSMLEYYAKRVKSLLNDMVEDELLKIVQTANGYVTVITDDIVTAKTWKTEEWIGDDKSAFLHDLSNSFTAVVCYTEMAVYFCEVRSYEKLDESFSMIEKCVHIANEQLVQEKMLDDANPDKSQSLQEIISKSVMVGKARNKHEEIKVVVDIPAVPIMISKGKTNYTRVFTNLICNASDALSGKSNTDESFIHVQAKIVNNCVEVSVADNGIGMDEKVQNKIFDSRFTTKSGNNHGIGLHFCKQFIEKDGKGRIWAVSEVGVGTIFYVSIPLDDLQ